MPSRSPFRLARTGILPVATAIVLAAAGSVAAAAPTARAGVLAGFCGPGERLISGTQVRTDRLGVARIGYPGYPGLVTTLPPRGLTAKGVTRALVADLGLPRRAMRRQRLVQEVLSLSRAPRTPRLCLGRPTTGAIAPGPHPFDHIPHSLYGGYAVTEQEFGGGINYASGTFIVGNDQTPVPSGDSGSESTWVGLGGGLGGETAGLGLIQGGVTMQTNLGYRTWIEYVGQDANGNPLGCNSIVNNCQPISNPVNSARPGDSVNVMVYWQSSTDACITVTDNTRSSGDIGTTCKTVAIPYDHTSAEWVNENALAQKPGFFYDYPGTISFSQQLLSATWNGVAHSPWDGGAGHFEGVIMTTGSYSGLVTVGCPANKVLAEGINAATDQFDEGTSQVESFGVNGCDQNLAP
jgi:hypothetical protein